MRRLEMIWNDGRWPSPIAEMILETLMVALDSEMWQRPDQVRFLREEDPVWMELVVPDDEE